VFGVNGSGSSLERALQDNGLLIVAADPVAAGPASSKATPAGVSA
jgi:hypothetical protein